MRRAIAFACEGETLLGTIDDAAGTTGLLIVSGGNEVRAGAHRGMAMLAGRLAAGGTPVFRFDRRGVGDSSGENRGFQSSANDLAAAARAFRQEAPQIARLVGFGNCDAASTLALFGREAGIDALVLANPWVVEPTGDLPPPAAIRARYATALRDPATWRRMLTGKVSLARLVRGLRGAAPSRSQPLTDRFIAAIGEWPSARVVLAAEDATALAYADAARRAALILPTTIIPTGSHSFHRPADAAALEAAVRAAL